MAMFSTAEVLVRLTAIGKDGQTHVVEFPMGPEDRYLEIWEACHSREDSSIPSHLELGALWAACARYRRVENELRAKCGLEPLPAP